MEIIGDIISKYRAFHIRADRVIIKMEDKEKGASEILLEEGDMTGCDLDKPNYFFNASEVVIYPDDHMVAKNVTFWELNGRIPLFYWPYLYISLKDKNQQLIPEVGYNAKRGWFIKTTYYHWYENRLPGEIYLDYYTLSGPAGGFKQYMVYQENLKSWLYLYGQDNQNDIPGLFNWEGAVDIEDHRGEWKSDSNLYYVYYDVYSYLKGNVNLSNQNERQNFSFNSQFKSQDYFLTDNNDDKRLDLDFLYKINFKGNWSLNLDYNHDFLLNPEDGLKKRWGSKSYLLKRSGPLDFKILLERYAPRFSSEEEEEDEVVFYRWPEIELGYSPSGPFSYRASLGHYYEDASTTKGYRGMGEIVYSDQWNLTDSLVFSAEQSLNGKIYQTEEREVNIYLNNNISDDNKSDDNDYLITYESKLGLRKNLTPNLTWDTRYNYTDFYGETPFRFDRETIEEKVKSSLNYRIIDLSLQISTGYDIYNEKYDPLRGILNWQVNQYWKLGAGTYYDLNTETFGDLAVTSKYKDQQWEINTGLHYDLNNNNLNRLDNQLVYELQNQWYLELNNSIDYEDDTIKKANILLKKNFHCRQLWFSYDYLKEEFVVEYHINIFPEKGVRLGSSEEEPFIFDLGIRDLLGLDQ